MAMFPLAVTAELLINGAWTDISDYLYVRDGIHITGGAVNYGDTPSPASCTFTVNNRDGRFSPLNPSSVFWPYLNRNVQVRLSVRATSSSGNFYSGYRFWGEITAWPPLSDISGHDVYVQVTASGPLRRANAAGGQGSALTRYYASLTGSLAPAAYWPCEEDPGNTGSIGTGVSAGLGMDVIAGAPAWKTVSSFNGSAPVAVLNNSTWDGLTGSFGTSGDDLFITPGWHTWVASTTATDCRVRGSAGGGENGSGRGGDAGGGGELARESALATTPGKIYTFYVPPGGAGGALRSDGSYQPGRDGAACSFPGDAATVTGHGGKGATSAGPGAGGTGSTNSAHHDGGAGGTGSAVDYNPGLRALEGGGGGGGGGSGGLSANGNPGGNAPGSGSGSFAGGAGAAAVTGGAGGGHGGADPDDSGITPGPAGGGGGGGGGYDPATGAAHSGTAGGGGSVELVYTPGAAPAVNVIRWIMFVPPHGGNPGKVLIRALTGGTIARLDCLYVTGGKLQLKGYNNAAALLFTSSNLTVGDGQTLMVSMELSASGANVAYKLTAIVPGAAAAIGAVTGTQATASMGSVSEILAGPNADITKTAIGHISVQYALIDITKVSRALNGHDTELSVDRFIRLANEQALANFPQFAETADHWGFETGTQSWAAVNGTLTQSAAAVNPVAPWAFTCAGTPLDPTYFICATAQAALIDPGDRFASSLNAGTQFQVTALSPPSGGYVNVSFQPMAAAVMTSSGTVTQIQASGFDPSDPDRWPTDGAWSLLLTANGAGQPYAYSPGGAATGTQPVVGGDIVTLAADLYSPAARSNVYVAIRWSNGTAILSDTTGPDTVFAAGQVRSLKVTGTAPAGATAWSARFGSHATDASGTLLYADNIRVSPQMGPQTRKEYAAFLKEVQQLDQGILKESKLLWGFGYKTRIAMINQAPVVTLDYSAGTISPPLAPVVDVQKITNHIVVRRNRGGTVTVTLDTGSMSTQEPPAGISRMKTTAVYAPATDDQLAALAAHLLNLGTAASERYPTITVNLARASLPGNAVAPLMSAVAGAEIGDYVQLTNLPFWFPAATAKQLIIGYDETIGPREWIITWNCTPEAPWEIVATALRRW